MKINRAALFISIICVMLLSLVVIGLTMLSSCDTTVAPAVSETSNESTEPSIETTAPSETSAAEELPDNVMADYMLRNLKTLEVTDTKYTLTVRLGITQTTVISRTDASVLVTTFNDFYEVKIADKTGQTIVINLSTSEYQKFLELI